MLYLYTDALNKQRAVPEFSELFGLCASRLGVRRLDQAPWFQRPIDPSNPGDARNVPSSVYVQSTQSPE